MDLQSLLNWLICQLILLVTHLWHVGGRKEEELSILQMAKTSVLVYLGLCFVLKHQGLVPFQRGPRDALHQTKNNSTRKY